jgi:hypothetical protein
MSSLLEINYKFCKIECIGEPTVSWPETRVQISCWRLTFLRHPNVVVYLMENADKSNERPTGKNLPTLSFLCVGSISTHRGNVEQFLGIGR